MTKGIAGSTPTCSVEGCGAKGKWRGWCDLHHKRWRRHGDPLWVARPVSVAERFWGKVDKYGPIPEYAPHLGRCWVWVGAIGVSGYGHFNERPIVRRAHRYSYELLVGPIPDGKELDHLCRVRACVNPAHLDPVTRAEHIPRGKGIAAINALKTHCPHGHAYDEPNTGRTKKGCRYCRACARIKHADARGTA